MSEGWPKTIDSGQHWIHCGNARQTDDSEFEIEEGFWPVTQPVKMLRAGLYARVSTLDQQTLPLQIRDLREYAAKRGWTVVEECKEVGSGAAARASSVVDGLGAAEGDRCRSGLAIGSVRPAGRRPGGNVAGTDGARCRFCFRDGGVGPDYASGPCNGGTTFGFRRVRAGHHAGTSASGFGACALARDARWAAADGRGRSGLSQRPISRRNQQIGDCAEVEISRTSVRRLLAKNNS